MFIFFGKSIDIFIEKYHEFEMIYEYENFPATKIFKK